MHTLASSSACAGIERLSLFVLTCAAAAAASLRLLCASSCCCCCAQRLSACHAFAADGGCLHRRLDDDSFPQWIRNAQEPKVPPSRVLCLAGLLRLCAPRPTCLPLPPRPLGLLACQSALYQLVCNTLPGLVFLVFLPRGVWVRLCTCCRVSMAPSCGARFFPQPDQPPLLSPAGRACQDCVCIRPDPPLSPCM